MTARQRHIERMQGNRAARAEAWNGGRLPTLMTERASSDNWSPYTDVQDAAARFEAARAYDRVPAPKNGLYRMIENRAAAA